MLLQEQLISLAASAHGSRVKGESPLYSLILDIENQASVFSICRREDVDCSHPFIISPLNTATLQSSEDTLPTFDLKAYARRGAEARIAELTAELNEIYRAFPDLRRGATRAPASSAGAGKGRRKRKPMSAAQKAEVSKRMKRYWAARRKSKNS
jgi:hypothetical protein